MSYPHHVRSVPVVMVWAIYYARVAKLLVERNFLRIIVCVTGVVRIMVAELIK